MRARPGPGTPSAARAAIVLVAGLGVASAAVPLTAQGATLLGGIAYQQGSPGASLASELERIGYGDTTVMGEEYPYYRDEGIPVSFVVGLRYRPVRPLSVELRVSAGPRGHARGYDRDRQETLLIAYTSLHAAGTVGVHLGPLVVRAGPALDRTAWTRQRNAARTGKGTTGAWGGTASAGVAAELAGVGWTLEVGGSRWGRTPLVEPLLVGLEPSYGTIFVALTASRVGL